MKKSYIILIGFIIISVILISFIPNYLSESDNKEPVEIIVSKGTTLTTVADDLYEKGVIRSRLWFRYNGQDIARNIKPGAYTIEPNIDIEDIYNVLQQGEQENHIKLTFPEGFILYQFAERVAESGFGTVEEFINATDKYLVENGYDFDTTNLYFNMEGYLFPDTYFFNKGQSVDEIVATLASTMNNSIFTDEYRSRAKELDLTLHEVLTIASLIEREAYNDEERANISGVIYNRLEINMPLQIDATVIYGIGEGKEHMTRVLYEDLETDNPYNTYKNTGLPPGPIASPGKNSIHAALYPEDHDYFYYVLGENGHVFSKTYSEHLNNVNKYRK
ncbi:endolytic transglycosylase MltG [Tissierella sp. Yu-01]|uniref:endolytic transglycosylase MltG n=1 Tax=Tissierella sp. Yu-01 TaxID=3035694 RepID=UPI00240D30D2|nr:endolytic transglycosylase MltG [Tissierella sp. Yu-01]WFA09473.1 endolytic transglycosylase MltG [Tissierella sp. Yu-01]